MPVESPPTGNQGILDLLHRARQEPVIVRDEADGEFAILPLDDDVIDLLLERNPRLIEECRPWIEAFELGARAMCEAADLAADGTLPRDEEAVKAALVPYLAALRDRHVRVFGDALDMFLADTTSTYTSPGRALANHGGGKR